MGVGLEETEFGLVGLDLNFALVFDKAKGFAYDFLDKLFVGLFIRWFLNLVDLFSEWGQWVEDDGWELGSDFLVAKLFVLGAAYEGNCDDSLQLVGVLSHLFGELVGKSIVWVVVMHQVDEPLGDSDLDNVVEVVGIESLNGWVLGVVNFVLLLSENLKWQKRAK